MTSKEILAELICMRDRLNEITQQTGMNIDIHTLRDEKYVSMTLMLNGSTFNASMWIGSENSTYSMLSEPTGEYDEDGDPVMGHEQYDDPMDFDLEKLGVKI